MCKDLLSLSLSMAFMLVITKFGNVVFQWYVNEMGIQTITGHTAARKIHEMLTLLLIYRNAMQSLGYKILPIIVSGIELVGKILPLGVLTGWWGYLGVCVLEPVLWTICSAVLIIGYMYAKRKWN